VANYFLDVSNISRGKGHSVTKRANYITGKRLHDSYNGQTYYRRRNDVLYYRVFCPIDAPKDFSEMQILCNKMDDAEIRWDARTARDIKGSLPNELAISDLIQIVDEYVDRNFVSCGLCAIAAIHEGHNEADPRKNNPHVHLIVSTRTISPSGFSAKKDREHDKRKYINIWREEWATAQNRAYERNELDIRVSHESLEVQGCHDREPTIHLSRIDWQRELRGEHTPRGDEKRAIKARNEERNRQRKLELERKCELELDLCR
jgi:hypothetical protein